MFPLANTAVALAAGLAVSPVALSEQAWVRARAPGLEVLTDASPGEARGLVKDLLRLGRVLDALGPSRTEETPALTLYAFEAEDSFRPFLPRYGGRVQAVGGFAQVGEEGAFGALALRAEGGSRRAAAYHEYAHLLLARTLPPAPPWLAEGLAELVSGWRAEPEGLVMGEPLDGHLRTLREEPWLPLADLLRVDYGSPLYNEGAQRSVFYAQSWALVHLLLLGQEGPPAAALARLAELTREGDPAAVFQAHSGEDLAATEKRLREHVARTPLPAWRIAEARPADEPEPKVDTPPPADMECRLGLLLLARGRAPDAASYLERSLRIDPGYVPAHLAQATLHAQGLDFARARQSIERARQKAPDDPTVLYRYADLLVKEGLHEGRALSQVETGAAIAALESSLRRAPWFAEAAELLVSLREDDPQALPGLVATVRRAIELNPGRARLHLTLARLHARRGDVAAARSSLALARQSPDESTRVLAAFSARRLEEYEAATAEVRGTLTRVRCLQGGALDFVVDAHGRYYWLRAASARTVFLFHPPGAPVERTLVCGEHGTAVVARYAPDPGQSAEGVHGRLLSLTFP